METVGLAEGAGITRAEADAQVARIEASGVLSSRSRAGELLSYLVNHRLEEGPSSRIKAYSIAVDVVGRGEDFDPASDSIVRVEIGRLRRLLEFYYLGHGKTDPVILSIPKGQLGIELRRRVAEEGGDPPQGGDAAPLRKPSPRAGSDGQRRAWLVGSVGALALLALVAFLAWPGAQRTPPWDAPVIAVIPPENRVSEPFADYIANGIVDQLQSELSHYRLFDVTTGSASGESHPDYALRTTVAGDGGDLVVEVTLVRTGDGVIVWSSRRSLDIGNHSLVETVNIAVSGIASALGSSAGVIGAQVRARSVGFEERWSASRPTDYTCYLRYLSFDLTKGPTDEDLARHCIGDVIEARRGNGPIWSAYAFLLFLSWVDSGGDLNSPMLSGATAAARQSVLLDPAGSDGYEALGSILQARGLLDEAFQAFETAGRLNPTNPDIQVKIGWHKMQVGDWDEGVAEIRAAIGRVGYVPGWYRIPLAMDGFRRADYHQSLNEARLIADSGDPRGLVLALAAAIAADDEGAERRYREELSERGLDADRAISEVGTLFAQEAIIQQYRSVLVLEQRVSEE